MTGPKIGHPEAAVETSLRSYTHPIFTQCGLQFTFVGNMEGRLHRYWPRRNLSLFEYTSAKRPISPAGRWPTPVVLLFVGGLGDTFLSVPYASDLAEELGRDGEAYNVCTVMQPLLSSSGPGWGTSNLDRDVEEIAAAIDFIRSNARPEPLGPGRDSVSIVLMGHSTGCQDVLHYLCSPIRPGHTRPPIQGAILQAPVSDREGLQNAIGEQPRLKAIYDDCIQYCASAKDKDAMVLPQTWSTELGWGSSAVSVARFESLASPQSPEQPGKDDLFSSDLSEERLNTTFGAVGRLGLLQASESTPLSPRSVQQRGLDYRFAELKALGRGSRRLHDYTSFHVLDEIMKLEPQGEVDKSNPARESFSEVKYVPSVLILVSGADQYMPSRIDKVKLLARWCEAVERDIDSVKVDEWSGIIEGAKHNLGGRDLAGKLSRSLMKLAVFQYLSEVGKSTGAMSSLLWRVLDEFHDVRRQREAAESGSREKTLAGTTVARHRGEEIVPGDKLEAHDALADKKHEKL